MNKSIFARVLGALGLVILVSSVVTLFYGTPSFIIGKLVLSAALIALWLALSESGGLKRFFTGRALHFGAFTLLSALAVVLVLGIVNWTAYKRPVSWDLTKNKLFTLSDETRKTVADLGVDVKVIALLRTDEQAFAPTEELLKRYAALSPRFTYQMIDPYRDPARAQAEAQRYAVNPADSRVVVVAGEQHTKPDSLDEPGLTNALIRVTLGGSRKVYFTTGHGEPDPADDQGEGGYAFFARKLAAEGYDVKPLSLMKEGKVPDDAAVVFAAGARAAFAKGEVDALQKYLAAGGHLGVFLEAGIDSGLDPLLKAYGIEPDDDVVLDVSPDDQQPGLAMIPVAAPTETHAIVKDLQRYQFVFPTARSLVALQDADPKPTPLALTGPTAWGETHLPLKSIPTRPGAGAKVGRLPLAMAVEKAVGAGAAAKKARLVVAGDSEFIGNQWLAQVGGNAQLAMNAASWLAQQEARVTVRNKGREGTSFTMTQAQATAVKFVTLDVLPVALLGLGLAVWMVRRSR